MSNVTDFIIRDDVLVKYIGPDDAKQIVIPKNVIRIEREAFKDCWQLTEFTIPDSVKSLGARVFKGCICLTSVNIGSGVTEIGENIFEACSRLTGIWVDPDNTEFSSDEKGVLFNKKQSHLIVAPRTLAEPYAIPTGVELICSDAFHECVNMPSVFIPDGVIELGERAFYKCTNLTTVRIPESLENVKLACFAYCNSLKEIAFPEKMTVVESRIFVDCNSLEEVTMPKIIDSLGKDIIVNCNNLQKLYCTSKLFSKFNQTVKDNVALAWLMGKAKYEKDLSAAIQKYIKRTGNRLFSLMPNDSTKTAADILDDTKQIVPLSNYVF